MNPVIAQVCRHRSVRPEQFFGTDKAAHVVAARCDAIQRLKRSGLNAEQIAGETKLHVQTVYYWLNPDRRDSVRKQSGETFRRHRAALGGRRLTKKQRHEILEAYLEDPAAGTAMACGLGMAPQYAYKLALAMGAIPRRGEQ